MITILDKDGNEFVPNSGDGSLSLLRHGVHDIDVVCYRNREWILLPLSRLERGDFFRKLGDTVSKEKVFLVTQRPRVVPHPFGYNRDPDIYLEGLKASTIEAMYEMLGPPALTRKGFPFSPSLVRLLG